MSKKEKKAVKEERQFNSMKNRKEGNPKKNYHVKNLKHMIAVMVETALYDENEICMSDIRSALEQQTLGK